MTENSVSGRQEPAYQLEVSRIFAAPPSAVRQAITEDSLRADWVPAAGPTIPDPSESVGSRALTWAERPKPGGDTGNSDAERMMRIELFDEPGDRTRLELQAGPYSEAGEMAARAWWDSAFSRLDTVLERRA